MDILNKTQNVLIFTHRSVYSLTRPACHPPAIFRPPAQPPLSTRPCLRAAAAVVEPPPYFARGCRHASSRGREAYGDALCPHGRRHVFLDFREGGYKQLLVYRRTTVNSKLNGGFGVVQRKKVSPTTAVIVAHKPMPGKPSFLCRQ